MSLFYTLRKPLWGAATKKHKTFGGFGTFRAKTFGGFGTYFVSLCSKSVSYEEKNIKKKYTTKCSKGSEREMVAVLYREMVKK